MWAVGSLQLVRSQHQCGKPRKAQDRNVSCCALFAACSGPCRFEANPHPWSCLFFIFLLLPLSAVYVVSVFVVAVVLATVIPQVVCDMLLLLLDMRVLGFACSRELPTC